MSWKTVISRLYLDQLPAFDPFLLLWNIYTNSNVKLFASIPSSGIPSFSILFLPFITSTFLTDVEKLPFVLATCVPPMAAVSISPQSSVSSIALFTFSSDFTSNAITFSFVAVLSSLFSNSLFQLSIFIKCHMGLSLGDKETTQLHTWLPAHEWNSQCIFHAQVEPCGLCHEAVLPWPVTSRLGKSHVIVHRSRCKAVTYLENSEELAT